MKVFGEVIHWEHSPSLNKISFKKKCLLKTKDVCSRTSSSSRICVFIPVSGRFQSIFRILLFYTWNLLIALNLLFPQILLSESSFHVPSWFLPQCRKYSPTFIEHRILLQRVWACSIMCVERITVFLLPYKVQDLIFNDLRIHGIKPWKGFVKIISSGSWIIKKETGFAASRWKVLQLLFLYW